jgi:hypothetical protein
VRASLQRTTLLMERGAPHLIREGSGTLLLAASFGEAPWSVELPAGGWRVLLDSGAAKLQGNRLSGDGRQAVVLERVRRAGSA